MRGAQTLRFGPMKPIGLKDPHHHVTAYREPGYKYGPTHVNYGLLPPLDGVRKDHRKQRMSERAREDLERWLGTVRVRAA